MTLLPAASGAMIDGSSRQEWGGRTPITTMPCVRRGELGFLSVHYWRDWADKRAPLSIVCPNGEIWEIDRKSSNGDGWKVTGTWPNLTCFPSIMVEGYHGWLRDGAVQR